MLSVGGRLVLINSVLSSLPMFILSFFEVRKGVFEEIRLLWIMVFWKSDKHKKKYRLTKWEVICTPKDQRRLGPKFRNSQQVSPS
jgi:hypothetical protein